MLNYYHIRIILIKESLNLKLNSLNEKTFTHRIFMLLNMFFRWLMISSLWQNREQSKQYSRQVQAIMNCYQCAVPFESLVLVTGLAHNP